MAASFSTVSDGLRDALTRVAVAGLKFDTDQFIALSGVDEDSAFDFLDEGRAAEVLEPRVALTTPRAIGGRP